MTDRMPQFEMPEEPPATQEPTSEPDVGEAIADDAAEPAPRDPRRALALLGIVGILVAIGAVFAWQHIARTLDEDAARGAVQAYVDAIAEGRAEDATALVPVAGNTVLLTDEVLATAVLIEDPEITTIALDGREGDATVGYRLAGTGGVLLLDLAKADGAWRVSSTLAAGITLPQVPAMPSRIGGVDVLPADLPRLYPGIYTIEGGTFGLLERDHSLLVVRGEHDPAELQLSEWTPTEAAQEEAAERASGFLAACGAACSLDAGASAEAQEVARLHELRDEEDGQRLMTLSLAFTLTGATSDLVLVELRAPTEEGEPVADWECRAVLGAPLVEWQPCGS